MGKIRILPYLFANKYIPKEYSLENNSESEKEKGKAGMDLFIYNLNIGKCFLKVTQRCDKRNN